MKVILFSKAERARYRVGVGEPAEVDDERALHLLNLGMAGKPRGAAKAERAEANPLTGMDRGELAALAEERGLEVVRADGKDGAPLKSDYLRALGDG